LHPSLTRWASLIALGPVTSTLVVHIVGAVVIADLAAGRRRPISKSWRLEQSVAARFERAEGRAGVSRS
jgi:hypothetical protein